MAALTEPPATPAIPARSIGRYELLEPLGRGGMGTVYKARQARLGKLVAVKLLDPARAGRGGAMSRFWREARAAAQIRHPNVVDVFDVGFDDGTAFLVMELLDGQDLAAHLATRGRLSLHEAIEVLAPVLSGVRAAHEAGVVHRDLKPSNIFLARRGRTLVSPVVLDFGVSRLLDDEDLGLATATSVDALIGTAAYVSPEQAKQSRLADDRSDQYALGVILYECVTGQRPFTGASTYELLHAIATARVQRPSELNPSLPEAFDAVVLRALSRDPERRYADLDDFAAALLGFAAPRTWMVWGRELLSVDPGDESPSRSTSPPSELLPVVPPRAPRGPASRSRVLLAFALGALLSAGAVSLGLLGLHGGPSRAAPAATAPGPRAINQQGESRPRTAEPATVAATAAGTLGRGSPLAPRLAEPVTVDSRKSAAPLTKPPRRPTSARSASAEPAAPVELGPNDAPILN
jgi:serine/threonine-protein kinase